MRDFVHIGSAPPEEKCVMLGDDNSDARGRKECQHFMEALRKKHGKEPNNAELKIRVCRHDFGAYHEVVCYYDTEDQASLNYALKCESNPPETWAEVGMENPSNISNSMSYEEWITQVDNLIIAKFGLGESDAADWPSRDTYNAGVTPENAVGVWVEHQDDLDAFL